MPRMTRIAVIADIHGNIPALEAVLDDIASAKIDEVLVNGDLVGRGPEGNAVVHRIRELGFVCTRGNHEDYALDFRRQVVPQPWLTRPEWACARWIAAELDDDAARFIDDRPMSAVSALQPQLRLFHGSPDSYNEGIGPWTSDDEIRRHLEKIEEHALIVAHTHRPLVWRGDDRLVVNVGSVGLPFNADTRAQYAIFDGDGAHFEVELRQVPYDLNELLDRYETTGFTLDGDNATVTLLRYEVLTGRPYLVPFVKWAEATNREPSTDQIPTFLDIYDHSESMAEFAARVGIP